MTSHLLKSTIALPIFHNILAYITPVMISFPLLSPYSPVYTLLCSVSNVSSYPNLVKIPTLLITGFISLLVGTTLLSTLALCILMIGYSIATLYGWMLFLLPHFRKGAAPQLRGGLEFHSSLKMYQSLRVLGIIETEFIRDMWIPCVHNALTVTMSTGALYYLLIDGGEDARILLKLPCILVLCGAFVAEFNAVCLIARAGTVSRLYIQRMTWGNERNLYRVKLLKGLQPCGINLEFLRSLNSAQDGGELSGFLSNYLDRVANHTNSLLLTN